MDINSVLKPQWAYLKPENDHMICITVHVISFFSSACVETAELTISLSVSPLHHPPFVLVQAENDLNELRALMHSPNAIVVSSPCPNLNWAKWQTDS